MQPVAEALWQEFLRFCGKRRACERLLLEFIRQRTRKLPPDVRGVRASSMLAVLSSRLALDRGGDVA